MFTFLLPESETAIKRTRVAFMDLHRSGVTLRMLLSIPPGNYISIKSPTTDDRIYFYRSMTDAGRVYFYSGIGKTGSAAKLGPLVRKGFLGGVSNRYGKTQIAPDDDTLRSLVSSFVQVHSDNKDIPAGRHTRRRRKRHTRSRNHKRKTRSRHRK
jgi:hypothetical protein